MLRCEVIIIATRLMGRKLISQMTFFDFVVGVSIGSIIASTVIGSVNSPFNSIFSLILISVFVIITDYAHIKSFFVRKIVDSEPVTLVKKGAIVEENMKHTRMSMRELNMKLREKNIFNLADVEFAIMETYGQLSVLPKVYYISRKQSN